MALIRKGKMNYLSVFGVLTILVVVGYIAISLSRDTLPSYASKDPRIKEAYLFVHENPDALSSVNCYCGCMEEVPEGDDRVHESLKDCFLEPNGDWESHGSGCSTCIDEALTVKELINQGKTEEDIINIIDSEYKDAPACDPEIGVCTT